MSPNYVLIFGTLPSTYLPCRIEELVNKQLDLIEEDRIDVRVELMTNQLLDVLLYLRPELLIVADQQLEQHADKLRDRAVTVLRVSHTLATKLNMFCLSITKHTVNT